MAVERQKSNPAMVVRIKVEKLFGLYTYDLDLREDNGEAINVGVLLLYGDNGSGKTTIAQLLYHLISRKDRRGHRTFLAQTKFQTFHVEFQNGATLAVERSGDALLGSYVLVGRGADGREHRVAVETTDDGSVTAGGLDEEQLDELLASISQPPVSVYYLSDNRSLLSDEFTAEGDDEVISHGGRFLTRKMGDAIEHMIVASRTRALDTEPSIRRAENWMRRQTIMASNVGEENISTIYNEIIKRISQTPDTKVAGDDRLAALLASLSELAARSGDFVSLGMISRIPITTLNESISQVPEPHKDLLVNVLEPYVDGIRARLSALSDIQQRLSTFVEIMNAFYRRKTVRVTIRDGIDVFDENGDSLEPGLLSSGEKQLLLLLCNIVAATSQPTIFIVDEPELSLNVKWQRSLVDSLLRLVDGSDVQFVMATHSIELLTQHMQAVLRLVDRESTARGESN